MCKWDIKKKDNIIYGHYKNEEGIGEQIIYRPIDNVYISNNRFTLKKIDKIDFFNNKFFIIAYCTKGKLTHKHYDRDDIVIEQGDIYISTGDINVKYTEIESNYESIAMFFELEAFYNEILPKMVNIDGYDFSFFNKLKGVSESAIIKSKNLERFMIGAEELKEDKFGFSLKFFAIIKEIIDLNVFKGTTDFDMFKSIEKYLVDNIDKIITLDEVSNKFSLGRTKIKNLFETYKNMSMSAYMREKRVEIAIDRLENTEISIVELAHNLGYNNPSKFSTIFKQKVGVLPSKYRK